MLHPILSWPARVHLGDTLFINGTSPSRDVAHSLRPHYSTERAFLVSYVKGPLHFLKPMPTSLQDLKSFQQLFTEYTFCAVTFSAPLELPLVSISPITFEVVIISILSGLFQKISLQTQNFLLLPTQFCC